MIPDRNFFFLTIFFALLVPLQLVAADLYWVGGTGNWSDAQHWSLSSGGAGGAGVPGIGDNVFFNDASFSTNNEVVSIDIDAACGDMSWVNTTGTPVLAGSSIQTIQIDGSLLFSTDMDHQFEGTYFFSSENSGNTINANGQTFNQDVIFDNADGEWILANEFLVAGNLEVRSGVFDTGPDSWRIEAQAFISSNNLDRTIRFGTSFVLLRQTLTSLPAVFIIGGDNLTLEADQSVINFRGDEGEMVCIGSSVLKFNLVVFDVDKGRLTSTTDLPPEFDSLEFNFNGEIIGDHVMRVMRLQKNYVLLLQNGSRQILTNLFVGGNCEGGFVNIFAFLETQAQAILQFSIRPAIFEIEALYLRNVHADNSAIGGFEIVLFGGFDGGGNSGWEFSFPDDPRELYWIGGSGDWNDPTHWADESGVSPQCVPTSIDNVYIDDNSLSANDSITGIGPAYANDFFFEVTGFQGFIDLPALYVNNDLSLLTEVDWRIEDVILIGNNEGGNTTLTDRQLIETTQNELINLISFSERRIFLIDDLRLSGDLIINGYRDFVTDGNDMTARSIIAENPGVTLNFANSRITIFGERAGLQMPLTILNATIGSMANTRFELTGTESGLIADRGPLGSVYFSSPAGTSIVRSVGDVTIQSLEFESNGQIIEENVTVDSLIFSAGKTYDITGNPRLSVNEYFESQGEICLPIVFQSFFGGISAEVNIAFNSVVNMQFTQIRDINATGGANRDAGLGSVDLGNNSGWDFRVDNENNVITQYLGNDRVLCSDTTLVLRPFEANEITSIVWMDNSTELDFQVPPEGGMIIAEVVFPNSCVVADTVELNFDQAFEIDLGRDTVLCEGESLNLNVLTDSASYIWQDNSEMPTYLVTGAGSYSVNVNRGACTESKSLLVDYNLIGPLRLGRDTTLCEGESIVLDPTNEANLDYLWQDDTNSAVLTATVSEQYWVQVSKGRCQKADSININFDPLPVLNLGEDTTLCAGEELDLDSGFDTGLFDWSTGDTSRTIVVTEPGNFGLSFNRGACMVEDEIQVDYIFIQQISLGEDSVLCEGETVLLDPTEEANLQYFWQDGSISPDFTVDQSGLYWVQVSKDHCFLSDSVNISFDPLPVLNLGEDTTLCGGQQLFLDSGLDSGIFNWSSGLTSPAITITGPGLFSLDVIRGACQVQDEINVDYIILEEVNLGSDTTLCEGNPLVLQGPVSSAIFLWDDGSQGQSLPVTGAGLYWLELSSQHCFIRDSINVSIDERPVFDLGRDTSLCLGEDILLDTEISNFSIEWNDGSIEPQLFVDQSGEYFAVVTNGTCTVSDTIAVNVIDLGILDLGEDRTFCEGEFYDLEVEPIPGALIRWSDGSSQATLRTRETNEYWAEISQERCLTSDTVLITFDPSLNFDLGADTTLCPADTLILSTGIEDALHFWVGGSEESSIVVTEAGTYGVFVQRGECMKQQTLEVTYTEFTDIDLGPDTSLCLGETLVLEPDFGPGIEISWPGLSSNAMVSINQDGVYLAQAGISGCLSEDSIGVTFQVPPSINIGNDTTICAGESVDLLVDHSADAYLWSTSQTTPGINVNTQDVYTVEVTDDLCRVVDSISIFIRDLPEVDLGGEIVSCEGLDVMLDASIAGASYLWQDGSTAATYNTSEAGTYTVQVSSNGCFNSDSARVSFLAPPVVNLGDNRSICDTETITIGINDPTYTYSWNTGSNDPEISIDMEGEYIVTATDNSEAACMASDTIFLEVRPLPQFDLGIEEVICENESSTLEVNGFFDSYIWNTGASLPSITIDQEGLYWAEASLNACIFRDSVNVRIQAFPIVDLGMDTTICEGTAIILDAANDNAVYEWNTGSADPSITVDQPGMYSVVVDIDKCRTVGFITLSTKPTPSFSLDGGSTVCEEETIDLIVDNPDWTITWSTGETTPAITVGQAGIYTATATLDGCSYSDDYTLSVESLPLFDLGDDLTICDQLGLTLTVDRSDVEITWQDGTVGQSIDVTGPGVYRATAMTDLGCLYEDEVSITNRECITFSAYVPNVFSPNNDGQNDVLNFNIPRDIILHSFSMRIFDRWGNTLFSSQDPDQTWDGRFQGNLLGPGVYVYIVELDYSDDFRQNRREVVKGDITLVR